MRPYYERTTMPKTPANATVAETDATGLSDTQKMFIKLGLMGVTAVAASVASHLANKAIDKKLEAS